MYFREDSAPGKYTASPTGGITGGSLVPSDYGSYGNDVALYRQNIPNMPLSSISTTMSFLYDSSLINPFNYNTPLQFFFNPLSDPNHYILAGIRGTGTQLEFALTGYYDASQNNPHAMFSLVSGHWYDLQISIDNLGGSFGQLQVKGQLFDLGTSGLNEPLLVASDSLSTYDAVFSHEAELRLGVYSERWGGAAMLDNFSVTAVPEPETYTMLLAGLGLMGFLARHRKITNQVDDNTRFVSDKTLLN